jgi:hypothetical protein
MLAILTLQMPRLHLLAPLKYGILLLIDRATPIRPSAGTLA